MTLLQSVYTRTTLTYYNALLNRKKYISDKLIVNAHISYIFINIKVSLQQDNVKILNEITHASNTHAFPSIIN